MKLFPSLAALLAVALTPLAAQAQGADADAAQALEQVVVTVNDDAITSYDLRQRVRLILASTQLQQPSPEILQAVQAQAIRGLIDERLQLQQAERFELEVPDEEVDLELQQLAAEQNVSVQEFVSQLLSAGIDPMTIRDQLRAQFAWGIIVRNLFAAERSVSDSEISAAMAQIVESASRPQYQLSEILIEIPEGATPEETMQIVSGVYQQLQAGAPFPAVARQISSAPSAPQGGDMGWVPSGALDPEVEAVVAQLQPGQVSPPIDTQDGIYLVALRGREEGTELYTYDLKQVLVPVAGAEDVERAYARGEDVISRLSARNPGCDGLEQAAARISDDAIVSDLGTVRPADLGEEYAALLQNAQVGSITPPVRSASGAVALVKCGRNLAEGSNVPTREQIERQLASEKLQRAAQRFLRDLRREATIEPDIRL